MIGMKYLTYVSILGKTYYFPVISADDRVRLELYDPFHSSPTKGLNMEPERPEVGGPSTSASPVGSDSLTVREMLAPLEGPLTDRGCLYALDAFDAVGKQPVCGRPAIKRAYIDDGIMYPMDYCRMHWNSVKEIPIVAAAETVDLGFLEDEE